MNWLPPTLCAKSATCFCADPRAPEKPNQHNTPMRRSLAAPETITIVAPCHPLYNQTFPLLHLKNHRGLVPSCLVQLPEGVERLIPLEVTNLAASPPAVYPLPLDLSSLHNLTKTFVRIAEQVHMEQRDEAAKRKPTNPDNDTTAAGVADPNRETAAGCSANSHPYLSQPHQAKRTGGEK